MRGKLFNLVMIAISLVSAHDGRQNEPPVYLWPIWLLPSPIIRFMHRTAYQGFEE